MSDLKLNKRCAELREERLASGEQVFRYSVSTTAYIELEELLKEKDKIILEQAECIQFYKKTKNWSVSRNPKLFNIMGTCDESHFEGVQISGMRARKCQAKHEKEIELIKKERV